MGAGVLVPVVRTKEIKPEGAEEHATALRNLAAYCRRLADDLRWMRSILSQEWVEVSQDRFFNSHGFASTPDELDRLAEWMEEEARRVDNKRVTVQYTEMVPLTEAWE
jgi:hypothetical protein